MKEFNLELLTWNTNFCWKKEDHNWQKFARELMKNDFDFILLQEINPFFAFGVDYKIENGPIYFFEHCDKNIYYHEFSEILLKERPHDIFWGTAIITNKNIKKISTHFYNINNEYIGLNYFGYIALMCYDFELKNGNVITIINYYKKGDSCKSKYDKNGKCINLDVVYRYEENFFLDISHIIKKLVKNENMIIFAGDFNITKRIGYDYDVDGIIKRIEKIGFINKTKHIGSSMVKYDNQNDYIFVNNIYSEFVSDGDKVTPPNFIDHYGIKCKIKI
jgi:endonuclease/exonuclease/phosphatase family metal-dependent hydrolase